MSILFAAALSAFTLVEGPVMVSARPAAIGAAVESGDRIETGEGRAELEIAPALVLRLGPRTRFVLSALGDRTFRGQLLEGDAWMKVPKRVAGQKDELEMSGIVARIGGSEIWAHVERSGTSLRVFQGEVRIEGKGGHLPIHAGEEIRPGEASKREFRPGDTGAFLHWIRSRHLSDGAEAGRVQRPRYRNPEQEGRLPKRQQNGM
jgi:FecR protein